MQFARILLSRALPQSFATQNPAPSRREPFRIVPPIEKHHQRKILGGVSYFSAKNAEATERPFFTLIQLIRNELIDAMYIVDHKEGGNRASSDIGMGVVSASVRSVFSVRIFLYETYGSRITVDRFEIDGGHIGKNVFRAIGAVSIVCNDDRALIGDGVDGIFQIIAFPEKGVIEREASNEDEQYSEQAKWTADRRCGDRPEQRKSHPEYCEDRKNRICLRRGNLPGSARPEKRFVIAQKGL